ncbi:hypothetical protein LTR08_006402 [Meristemomyces frigidus]|nr:hypothetical protein LTR08_006402 [Meristemomyces frigidus]
MRPKLDSISETASSVYDPEFLRKQTRWIRDQLDPQIARDGRDALHSDEVLMIDQFLRRLLKSNISVEDIRHSRIHLAVMDIAGHATRWPERIITRCEALKESWEAKYGPLRDIGILLYEPGGRLHGICTPTDLSKEKLCVKWLKSPTVKFSPLVARRFGNLGFTPGEWWISPLFAFRDGIIDSSDNDGRIVADANGAYAVFMTGSDEIPGGTPEAFAYRARGDDKGRYRLTSGTPESRQPLGYAMMDLTGWSIKPDPKSKGFVYDISFRRLSSEISMDKVLSRPWTDEVEDYKEYKRLRNIARGKADKIKTIDKLPTMLDGDTKAHDWQPILSEIISETPSQAQQRAPSISTTTSDHSNASFAKAHDWQSPLEAIISETPSQGQQRTPSVSTTASDHTNASFGTAAPHAKYTPTLDSTPESEPTPAPANEEVGATPIQLEDQRGTVSQDW